jgi:hypothetical protein
MPGQLVFNQSELFAVVNKYWIPINGKLEGIRARIESLQEYAATEIQLLTDAETKLSAALIPALLSTQGQR